MQGLGRLFTDCHGTQAPRCINANWTDSLETMYKVRLTEFVFKCMKGFTVMEFKDLFIQRRSGHSRKDGIIFPRPETNFNRNSISYRGAISWNSLTNKETTAKPLKDFKRCLRKFDTDKINFEPILAITNNKDTTRNISDRLYFLSCTYVLTYFFFCNYCLNDPTSNADFTDPAKRKFSFIHSFIQ